MTSCPTVAAIYSHFKAHAIDTHQAQLKRVGDDAIILKLYDGERRIKTLPLKKKFAYIKIKAFKNVSDMIDSLKLYADKYTRLKKIVPAIKELHEFKDKHKLTRAAISEIVGVSERNVGYWFAKDHKKRIKIPYACWRVLKLHLEG